MEGSDWNEEVQSYEEFNRRELTAELRRELTAEFRRVRRRVTQSFVEYNSLRNSAPYSAYLCGYKKMLAGRLTISVSRQTLLG